MAKSALIALCTSLSCGRGTSDRASVGSPQRPQNSFALTVSRSDAGRVNSTPSGIDCGTICSAAFETGTIVTLAVKASPGFVFIGWEGACSGQGACSVTMGADAFVTARFAVASPPPPPPTPSRYRLTITRDPQGYLTISPEAGGWICDGTSAPCLTYSEDLAPGTLVILTPLADPYFRFTGWDGACSGTAPECRFTMDKDTTVRVHFGPTPDYKLMVGVHGSGKV
ncbi:MAG: InlB B-repeat-containing protein, partial [Myxococcales bacterium]